MVKKRLVFRRWRVALCLLQATLLLAGLLTLPISAQGAEETAAVFSAMEESEIDTRTGAVLPSAVQLSGRQDSSLPTELIPGGVAFGVKMYTRGVWIVGFSDIMAKQGKKLCPAQECGLKIGDVILSMDGTAVNTVTEVTSRIEACQGKSIRLNISRGKTALTLDLLPAQSSSDGVYRAGFWIRDNTSGIGTVTYIDPQSGSFGGLGHGVCDTETGRLMPFSEGIVLDVAISGVIPGKAGVPGELKGHLKATKTGALLSNTDAGIFGILATVPEQCGKAIPVASKSEVTTGSAVIRCTLDGGGIREYEIRIDALRMEEGELKNYEITVTDPELLKITGGIVQGMSGSPIIQNGKLIGAVTHVLINNPSKGYGIFIGNMLSTAK